MKKSTQTIEVSPATHKRLKRRAEKKDDKVRKVADQAINVGLDYIEEKEGK